MLIRISLIVAIIAGLAVGGLNFVKVKEKITTLMTERDNERTQKESALRDLQTTQKDLDKTKADLTQTKQDLESTTAERDKAVAEATRESKRATQLATDLASTRDTLTEAQATLEAYRQSNLSPEQVISLAKQLKQLQDSLGGAQEENRLLGVRIRKLENELALYKSTEDFTVPLPAGIQGKVLAFDPKWDFVVLNVGENVGVLEHGEFLVYRNGSLVAKVRVRSVDKERSVANIVPGWKKAEIIEGDQIIPANPAS